MIIQDRRNSRRPIILALLTSAALAVAGPAKAAEVTSDRLNHADREPQNWLMNYRTYDAQRYSPLDKINRGNVRSLKLAYAVAIGGTSANENLEATPLAEDGFLYVVDQWGVVYKIDGRSGDVGRIMWRMDPGQEKIDAANRGAALWGNLVVSVANYPPRMIATDKETGRIVWETSLSDGQAALQFSAAPLAVKNKIIIGAAGGDRGVRDFIVAIDAATGKLAWRNYVIPAPANPVLRPGKTRTTLGKPVAAPCGSQAPTMSSLTRCCGALAIRCRCTIRSTALATISSQTA